MNVLVTKSKQTFKKFVFIMAISLLTLNAKAQSTYDLFTTAGTHTWVVPDGVSSVMIGTWGAGGGGGGTLSAASPLSNPRAGAGGGGAFSAFDIAVVPGDQISYTVGAGGTGGVGAADGTAGQMSSVTINGTIVVSAEGGKGGSFRTSANVFGTATGLGGASGVGFLFAGGNGGAHNAGVSGAGGGGAAGTTENGHNGTSTAHGIGGTIGGGAGGLATTSGDQNGNAGSLPGGGGGGSSRAALVGNSTGGNGASGGVAFSYCKVPNQPVINAISTAVCESSVHDFSVVMGANTDSYIWTLPADWNGTSESNSIGLMAGSLSGDIIVEAVNACGTSEPLVVAVVTTPLPTQPSIIDGNATTCEGEVVTYSVTENTSVDSYTWTLPANWVANSDSNAITVTATQNGGAISVTSENECGISPVRVLNVTIGTAPLLPSEITGGTVHCQGVAQSYSVTADPNVENYTWTLPTDWSGTSTTNSIPVTIGANSGHITVVAHNMCGTSPQQVLDVTINQIEDSVSVEGITMTAVQNGAVYQWLDCATGAPISNATLQSFTPTENGEYSVLIITPESCTVVSECISVNSVSVETSSLDAIAVFPNPATDNVTVANAPAGSTIRLMDMTGKVLTSKVASTSTVIDLSDIKAGVYFLTIESKKAAKTQKIVVRK